MDGHLIGYATAIDRQKRARRLYAEAFYFREAAHRGYDRVKWEVYMNAAARRAREARVAMGIEEPLEK